MSLPDPNAYGNRVYSEIGRERAAQDAKWGEQNHPDGTGDMGKVGREMADASRRLCQSAAAVGMLTWRHILDEEYREALAEEDPAKLRAELVQVAAVAVAWIEAIDRREGPGSTSPEPGPAVGVRVGEEDLRRAVSEIDPAQFRRESLGEWPPDASPEPGPTAVAPAIPERADPWCPGCEIFHAPPLHYDAAEPSITIWCSSCGGRHVPSHHAWRQDDLTSSPEPGPPTRRLRACVEAWPEAETMGYDPRCCRFPKSCSATVYDEHLVDEADLEPVAEPTKGGTE